MAEVNKDDMTKSTGRSLAEIKPREAIGSAVPTKKPKAVEATHEETFGDRIVRNAKSIDYEDIKDRLLFDWLFPEIIATIGDILRMIFSKDGRGKPRSSKRHGYTSYNSIYDEKHGNRERKDPTRQDFRKIRLEFYERDVALEVLDELRERLERSNAGRVSVRELYSLADLPTNPAMLNWVWYDLEDCSVERVGDNYILIMPPAEGVRG